MWRIGVLFLLSVMAVAQNSPQKKSNSFQLGGPQITPGTNLSGNFKNHRLILQSADSLSKTRLQFARRDALQLVQGLQSDRTCYAIRSYIFRREDSRAPVLVKTTTCTHTLLGFQQVSPHKVMRAPSANQAIWATSYQPL